MDDSEDYVDPVRGKKGEATEKSRFIKRYPYADMSRFNFEAKATSGIGVVTWFVDLDGITSFDIRYDGFKKDKEYTAYLTSKKPYENHGWTKMWIVGSGRIYWFDSNDTIDGFSHFPKVKWSNKAHSFNVYVGERRYFNTSRGAGGNMIQKIEDIVKVDGVDIKFDYTKPYFASLCGAYIATYLCGITTDHLTPNNDTYPVITSIMNFHLYYCMRKYIYNPKRLIPYMDRVGPVKSHIPITGTWEKKSDYYDVVYDKGLDWEKKNWLRKRGPNNNPVRGVANSAVMTINGFLKGIRVNYEERTSVKLVGKFDYMRFVSAALTYPPYGLTKTGLLLLGESIEAFTYSVIGAQAATRSPITGSYGKSSATHVKFGVLVKDMIVLFKLIPL
jgi:hypothetical protein